MKLAAGSLLGISLRFDDAAQDDAVGRVVMARDLAMLEWSSAYLAG